MGTSPICLISVSGFESMLLYFCQGDITGLCFLISLGTVRHKSTSYSCSCIQVPGLLYTSSEDLKQRDSQKEGLCLGFFFFPSFFGKDKIAALLGATQQMMVSGPANSSVAAHWDRGVYHRTRQSAWQLIRGGCARRAYQGWTRSLFLPTPLLPAPTGRTFAPGFWERARV